MHLSGRNDFGPAAHRPRVDATENENLIATVDEPAWFEPASLPIPVETLGEPLDRGRPSARLRPCRRIY